MADKENNWEDMKYSDDEMNQSSENQEYDDNEYSDEEYEDDDNSSVEYEDDENAEDEEDDDRPQKKGFPIILAILVILILLVIGGFLAYSKFSSGGIANNSTLIQQENFDNNQDNNNAENSGDMGDFFFNEAGGNESNMMSVGFNENGETNVATDRNGENVATVTDQTDTKANDLSPDDIFSNGGLNANDDEGNNAIMVSYNKALRLNPFKPPVAQKNNEYSNVNNTDFEIIEPPSTSNPDENLKRLLQTQISGIMYDDVSPSAIVNLNGVDRFVKIGDVVSGYKIENITKNKVQISYKNNSYVASVGELFTRGYVEKQQAVVNLEHKFAGRYRNN